MPLGVVWVLHERSSNRHSSGVFDGGSDTPSSEVSVGPGRAREQPPQLPDAVRQFTAKGIEATIRFEIDAFNYAQRTGDLDPLQKVYNTPTCKFCKLLVERFSADLVNGSYFVDGEYTVTAIEAFPGMGRDGERIGDAIVAETQPKEAKLIDKDGKQFKNRPANSYAKIRYSLSFSAGHWVIQEEYPGEKQ
ncbi:MAG: hypothetical protein DLM55_10865 [Acidimicrobiales bacterium]|nr:MAG: hypothetical protein DLM55_10865 [Acidimicrobiales bacterium]